MRPSCACWKVHVCHFNSLDGATWRSLMITGRTDRRTDRVQRNMRPRPREEGRIKIHSMRGPFVKDPQHERTFSLCGHGREIFNKSINEESSTAVNHWRRATSQIVSCTRDISHVLLLLFRLRIGSKTREFNRVCVNCETVTIAGGGSNGSRGWAPWPPHFNHWRHLETHKLQRIVRACWFWLRRSWIRDPNTSILLTRNTRLMRYSSAHAPRMRKRDRKLSRCVPIIASHDEILKPTQMH